MSCFNNGLTNPTFNSIAVAEEQLLNDYTVIYDNQVNQFNALAENYSAIQSNSGVDFVFGDGYTFGVANTVATITLVKNAVFAVTLSGGIFATNATVNQVSIQFLYNNIPLKTFTIKTANVDNGQNEASFNVSYMLLTDPGSVTLPLSVKITATQWTAGPSQSYEVDAFLTTTKLTPSV
jgi:hypothetical protein